MKFLLILLLFGVAAPTMADARSAALLGVWNCGPYTVAGEGFSVTGTETSTYLMDGKFRGTSEYAVRLASGRVVRMRDRSFGSWTLKNDIIEIRYDKVEFLSSDNPAYTVQMGQAAADAQQEKKNWSKAKILELGDKLITVPVEAMYKGAEVVVTCVRL